MSYVVLARKWRPLKFEDVVSQDHVSTTLKNAIRNDRLASAYLFSGPRGVGKTTTARIFAKAINCDNGPTTTPCNSCTSCIEITESRSLDVFEIDGASNRGIDEVRNLRENLKYAASKGKHKIYIIDEVHMLTTEAFNALLKTLEEPPPRVLFIFATTEFHKVPATILSRCQRYDFRRIPPNEIVEQLRIICEKENIKISEEALYLIAKKADGALRDSQSILDQVISFCGEDINMDDLTELLGLIDHELFFECSDAIAKKDVPKGLQLVEKIFNQGYDMAEFLNGLAEHFRNLLVVKATNNTDLLEGLETFKQRYQDAVKVFNETDLLRLIQLTTDSAFHGKRSTNPKLILEMAVVKMIKMDKSVELSTLLSNLGGLGSGSSSADAQSVKPVKKPESIPTRQDVVTIKQIQPKLKDNGVEYRTMPEPAPPPAIENLVVSLEKIKSEWDNIVEEVKSKKIHLGSFLNEGYPTNLNLDKLEISFGKDNGFHIKTIETNKRIVQDVIYAKTGFQVRIQCHKSDSEEFNKVLSQRREPPIAEKAIGETSEKDYLQIPILKKVIEVFDGEIVKNK